VDTHLHQYGARLKIVKPYPFAKYSPVWNVRCLTIISYTELLPAQQRSAAGPRTVAEEHMTSKARAEQFRANAANCDRHAKDSVNPTIAGALQRLAQQWREPAAQVESFSELNPHKLS
jgi:hypothetical protein